MPVAAATMTPLPLLAALIVIKIRECFSKGEKLPVTEDKDQSVSIIKTRKMDNHEMSESDSKVKLVANGDANENCLA